MWEILKAAIPLGFVLAFIPGAAFFVLLETSASRGYRAAISFDLGVVFADIIFILIAYFSSYQLLENLSNQPGLYVFGGMILLVYGVILFLNKETAKEKYKVFAESYVGLFVKGFLLNFINVGVLVFWLGVLLWIGPALNNDGGRIFMFFLFIILSYFSLDLVKIAAAKQLKRYLTKNRIVLLRKGLGVLLVVCGTVLITQGFLPKDKLHRFEKEAPVQIDK
ncbi:LysE family translocator [Aureicoccus marinus]|uniref:Lysine transporter LysE n=1 Tax=Aureicoccus marinus TaxID=754435 RepID=A0A2S7T8K2_9FLAO|nr:LysE family transporter [Aureicoccus marinus]PQJ16260.1 lysine transporter LysE [Aureicoccus marinus]